MSRGNLILFNKPYGVLSQFTGEEPTLARYVSERGFYPAGRLDMDSEGLLLLTNEGTLQARIANPRFKMEKTYWVQVEGQIEQEALIKLSEGIELKDGRTRPAKARQIESPLPRRDPDIRRRKSIPTNWLELTISEGKNRQVRRMTAEVGLPTLRLYRASIGPWTLDGLEPGEYRITKVNY